ncbi:Elicitor-responsive protein 3-like protein [Drosera capensis]
MEKGILEVLLVNAEGIRHTNLIGRPAYYVLIKCGTHVWRSKTTSGYTHEAYWNQKFRFRFPALEWEDVEHMKVRIMNEEYLTHQGFVGQTKIDLRGIITEAKDTGFIEIQPASYNVVIEDDTFKGEIKIGLKFIVEVILLKETLQTSVFCLYISPGRSAKKHANVVMDAHPQKVEAQEQSRDYDVVQLKERRQPAYATLFNLLKAPWSKRFYNYNRANADDKQMQ